MKSRNRLSPLDNLRDICDLETASSSLSSLRSPATPVVT